MAKIVNISEIHPTLGYTEFDILEKYRKSFNESVNGTNKNCKESIFEIQFTGNTSDGAYHQHVMHYWVAAPVLRGWDEIRPSEMILNEYRKEGRIATTGNLDSRAYASMFFDDPYFNDGNERIY